MHIYAHNTPILHIPSRTQLMARLTMSQLGILALKVRNEFTAKLNGGEVCRTIMRFLFPFRQAAFFSSSLCPPLTL